MKCIRNLRKDKKHNNNNNNAAKTVKMNIDKPKKQKKQRSKHRGKVCTFEGKNLSLRCKLYGFGYM